MVSDRIVTAEQLEELARKIAQAEAEAERKQEGEGNAT
jgi:hypothetical protein